MTRAIASGGTALNESRASSRSTTRLSPARQVEQRAKVRAERRHKKREAILDTARQLYKLHGYEAVSMRGVAAQLGFSKQNIYYYFASKEEIFLALQEEGIRKLQAASSYEELADPLQNVRLPYWGYYQFSKAHPEYFHLLWVDPAAPRIDWKGPRFQRLAEMGEDNLRRLRRCMAEGVLPETLDVMQASSLLHAAIHGCAVLEISGHSNVADMDRLAATLLDMVIAGLRTAGYPVAAASSL